MNYKRLAASVVAAACILVYNGTAKADALKVTARSAVVMEQSSHRVLFEKNAHERLAMASTTKIMTALVALEHGSLTDIVTVSPNAARVGGSSIYLKAGEKLTLEQLLYGLMLQSGNDASVAIAEYIGGSVNGFLDMMNKRAAEIGAVDTHFASPNGLDCPGHYTTAFDLALIAATAMGNANFRTIVSTKGLYIPLEGQENGRYIKNKNKILWSYDGANGVKTGYTSDAGRCFVGSAEREGMQLISVVLDCGPMFEEAAQLMDETFAQYDMIPVVEPRMAMGDVQDAEGVSGTVRFGAPQKLLLPLNKEEQQRVATEIHLWDKVKAPVAFGQPLGEGQVVLDGKVMGTFPVISLEKDDERTIGWYAKKIVEGFVWRMNGEESGYKSFWPRVE
jgi:serine-type D-Ala-D-Ala carboxypeptidase (penicillin-binding protein 5/6)